MQYHLEEVVEAFELWRASRLSRSDVIPERLWSMARTLVPHHKKSHIQTSLRISGKHFIKHCLAPNSLDNQPIEGGFAIAEALAERRDAKSCDCEITIKGTQRSLHINLSIEQLPQILAAASEYL